MLAKRKRESKRAQLTERQQTRQGLRRLRQGKTARRTGTQAQRAEVRTRRLNSKRARARALPIEGASERVLTRRRLGVKAPRKNTSAAKRPTPPRRVAVQQWQYTPRQAGDKLERVGCVDDHHVAHRNAREHVVPQN